MTNGQAIVLGIVQGITEYLPISSSAHLVLVPHIMGWHFQPKEAFIFDVLVQLGTLLGVFIYFFIPIKDIIKSVLYGLIIRKPFYNESAKLGWMVALATIPAALAGFLFKEEIAKYFSSPLASCYFLMLSGFLLFFAEYMAGLVAVLLTRAEEKTLLKPREHSLTKKNAVFIGCAQGFALFPGLSRSGATIAAGMACGLSRERAARFSFLMSIPIMLGASILAGHDLLSDRETLQTLAMPITLGFCFAAFTGYFVIKWFMSYLGTRPLFWFAVYCLAMGLLGSFYF